MERQILELARRRSSTRTVGMSMGGPKVLLRGTFESISFDVFKANAESDGDGSGLQISVEVPEPTTTALIALGLFGVGAVARRRKVN